MQEEKSREKKGKEEQPLDAKLLSDAVIELNISRRSVGLYPPEHPITKQSIKSAYLLLKKLFEIRNSITLGVAKDVLMVDEYTLDRNNPVFMEFAFALHLKSIASITFYSGLEEHEVLILHELISDKDLPAGQGLIELDLYKKLRHIKFVPIDISRFKFVEGARGGEKDSGQIVWEDYVYGLMEGKLEREDAEGVVLKIPAIDVASFINNYPRASDEGYDRIITSYLSKKGRKETNREALKRFITLVEHLSPDIKKQLLQRAASSTVMTGRDADEMLASVSTEEMERMINLFKSQSVLPESLRNVLDKLSETGIEKDVKPDVIAGGVSIIDDILVNEDMLKLFEEDKFGDFVDEKYQKELNDILKTKFIGDSELIPGAKKSMSPEIIDNAYSDIILELVNFKHIKREDYINLLTRLAELADTFLETGRFDEVLHIHNIVYSRMLTGSFGDETHSMLEYFFRSEQFVSKLVEVLNLWGRNQRDSAIKLARVLKLNLIPRLFESLNIEESAHQRRFYLTVLSHLGSDALKEAADRLDDERWYVVRNMIFLLRISGGKNYIKKIRPLIRHKNKKVRIEALKTLLHFNAPDAFSCLRTFLSGRNSQLKESAIKLSGTYRVEKAVPFLLKILDKKVVLGSDLHCKPLAIQALGKIGDPTALENLKKLFKTRSLLYSGAFQEIRQEIVKSLANYPFEQAGPILELAIASGNEETKAIAEKLISGDWNA
jgi:HEAT repeat protein